MSPVASLHGAALGAAGTSEARVEASLSFLFQVTLAPGDSFGLSSGFEQRAVTTYAPAPVPLPAAGWLLAAALGGLAPRARRG